MVDIRSREEAVKEANKRTTNIPGSCQMVTRGYYNAPSVGDLDGDGSADAEDGWKSEPEKYRHEGDRNPPRGVPVTFKGGSHDNWHRAISKGNGVIRSTDMDGDKYAPGVTSDTTIPAIEQHMGLPYVGWSDTIDGLLIPNPPLPDTEITLFYKSKPLWDVNHLDKAIQNGRKGVKEIVLAIDHQVSLLPNDPGSKSLVDQFVARYDKDRILKMTLLNHAVANGRVGEVKKVRDELRKLIKSLPDR